MTDLRQHRLRRGPRQQQLVTDKPDERLREPLWRDVRQCGLDPGKERGARSQAEAGLVLLRVAGPLRPRDENRLLVPNGVRYRHVGREQGEDLLLQRVGGESASIARMRSTHHR